MTEDDDLNECRRCLDHFANSYYCTNLLDPTNSGACCPFPENVSADLRNQIEPFCIDSPQFGQQCSHRLEASAIATEKAID